MKEINCKRCGNKFSSNELMVGDDVCTTCSQMNCMTFWYPRLFRLNFPMPKTVILHTNLPLEDLADGQKVEGIDRFITDLRLASAEVGWPTFLRTGYLSNKHDWNRSCFLSKETVKDKKKILQHVANLVEMSAMANIDRMMPIDFWAVREFIKTKPYFTYFAGEMPITKERRFFVKNGEVECHHSYWPRGAFKESISDEMLSQVAEISKEEEESLVKMAEYVSKIFQGSWSCDFLKGENGQWYLTDMAIGEQSYHSPHANQ